MYPLSTIFLYKLSGCELESCCSLYLVMVDGFEVFSKLISNTKRSSAIINTKESIVGIAPIFYKGEGVLVFEIFPKKVRKLEFSHDKLHGKRGEGEF